MSAICGILGKRDTAAVDAMARALEHRGEVTHREEGEGYVLASSSPIVEHCLIDGEPRDAVDAPLTPQLLQEWCRTGQEPSGIQIRGAFSAVVRGETGDRYWLLRDRLGRKPLYYFQCPDYLLFASELKALLATGIVEKRLDLASVDRYLTLRCVPGPDSIIQGLRRVRPGHVLRHERGKVAEAPFSGFDLHVREVSRDSAAAAVRERLESAVRRGPGGVLLWSAGIDCAALAALRRDLRPLFVSLARAWQDEARLARESARRLKLPLESLPGRRLTDEAFARVVRCLDEPVADATVFPLWLIFECVAEVGNRAIAGHGADELLGGYPRYRFLKRAHGARGLVPSNQLAGLLPALPPNVFVRRGSRYLATIRDSARAYMSLLSVFDDEERAMLYTDVMKAALHERRLLISAHGTPSDAVVEEHFTGPDLMRNLLSLDLGVILPDLMLASNDRLAAAHGLSVEFPYLDDALLDFVVTLSPETKFGVRSKPLLRQAMKGILPPRVRLRARRGFRIPHGGQFVRLIDHVTRQVITPERVDATGLFKWNFVEQVVRSSSHNVYRRRQFWALLMFFAWYREVMEA